MGEGGERPTADSLTPGMASGFRLDPRGRRIVAFYAVVILTVVSWLAVDYFLESRFGGTAFHPELWSQEEPTNLTLGHWSCDGEFRTTVDETPTEIRVLLEIRREGEEECGGGPAVELDAPVGERVVVDLHTGRRFRAAPDGGMFEQVNGS